jgi:hypothetical protein
MGDFDARMSELAARVGSGDLEGSVEYDQPYAQNQHESLGFRHPQGGQAKFLESAQQERFTQYLERVGDGVLTDGGDDAMVKAMEDLADASSDRAPIGDPADRAAGHPGLLKASAHPKVSSSGAVVYDRPGAPRQTDTDTTPGDRRGNQRGPGR